MNSSEAAPGMDKLGVRGLPHSGRHGSMPGNRRSEVTQLTRLDRNRSQTIHPKGPTGARMCTAQREHPLIHQLSTPWCEVLRAVPSGYRRRAVMSLVALLYS